MIYHAGNFLMTQNKKPKGRLVVGDIYRLLHYILFQVKFTMKLFRHRNMLVCFRNAWQSRVWCVWREKDEESWFLKREEYNKVMKVKELFVSLIWVINKSLSYCHYFPAFSFNRKLKKRRQRLWRPRLVKNKFIFYQQNLQLSRSAQHSSGSKNVLRLNISNSSVLFQIELWKITRRTSLHNRRNFLRIFGEQRRKRGKREARVACEGRIAILASLSSQFPWNRQKITPVL